MKQQRFYLLTTLRADPAGLGRTGSFQLHRRGLLVWSWRNQDGFLLVPSIHRCLSVHPLALSHRIAALRAVTQRSEKAKEDATSSPDAKILEFMKRHFRDILLAEVSHRSLARPLLLGTCCASRAVLGSGDTRQTEGTSSLPAWGPPSVPALSVK